MKLIAILLVAGISAFALNACTTKPAQQTAKTPETTGYDPVLARQLGADGYGMKVYVMAFLKRGPNRSQDSATAANLQKAHLENINRLASEGKLVLAGPFMDNTEVRGIYIFNVTSVEEARKLTESDPAVEAGRLTMDLHQWYGSAALMQVNSLHRKLEKKNVAE